MRNLFSVLSDLMSKRQWVNRLLIALFALLLVGVAVASLEPNHYRGVRK